jgi:RNA polymerase sigma-70 factor (ECF subfamily)
LPGLTLLRRNAVAEEMSGGAVLHEHEAVSDDDRLRQSLVWSGAFTEVFAAHHATCLRLARRLVRDEGLAQDVVQDVFLSWWRMDGGGYRADRGELAAWLSTITHHKAVDAMRTSERHRRLQAAAEAERAVVPEVRLIEEVVWWELGKQSLLTAMVTLPPKQRDVVGLTYFAGLTQVEVAARLGIPLGTVKSRTHAALLRLKAAMSGSWTPAGPDTSAPDDQPEQPAHVRSVAIVRPRDGADSAMHNDAERCAAALVRIAAEEPDGTAGAAATLSRSAALVERHGDAGMAELILALARLAAGTTSVPGTHGHGLGCDDPSGAA